MHLLDFDAQIGNHHIVQQARRFVLEHEPNALSRAHLNHWIRNRGRIFEHEGHAAGDDDDVTCWARLREAARDSQEAGDCHYPLGTISQQSNP